MTLEISDLLFEDVELNVERGFRHVAQNKGLELSVERAPNLPASIRTDGKRLQQVLKNLLSNAFKFTEGGQVVLRVEPVLRGWSPEHPTLGRARRVVAFSVSDTGIGIRPEKLKLIFEAFQQADMTTSRRYGGTGLGLSISREIARLLGGEIQVASAPGEGSTFTLYVPQEQANSPSSRVAEWQPAERVVAPPEELREFEPEVTADISDDRTSIKPGDRVLLIMEGDNTLASALIDRGRGNGFKVLRAARGDAGLALARRHHPSVVVLNLRLPDVDGWTVLDRLKHDALTRHIPVQVLSEADGWRRAMQQGAFAFMRMPASNEALTAAFTGLRAYLDRTVRRLLIVEDDDLQRSALVELLGGADVSATAVGSGAEALAALETEHYDCVVLDLGLPDMTGEELLRGLNREGRGPVVPVIVYTGRDLTAKQEEGLKELASSIIIKDVRSVDRLLAETALILHRAEANLPEPQRRVLQRLHQTDPVLVGRKVLVADDDARNLYALTSILEHQQMEVLHAVNGRDAVEQLERSTDVDVVLMDVMMPEMDGYEAMRRIREIPRFSALPIIALTAKAMKGDREKCIEEGASDYIPKPVDTDQLLSLLRVWLYR